MFDIESSDCFSHSVNVSVEIRAVICYHPTDKTGAHQTTLQIEMQALLLEALGGKS